MRGTFAALAKNKSSVVMLKLYVGQQLAASFILNP